MPKKIAGVFVAWRESEIVRQNISRGESLLFLDGKVKQVVNNQQTKLPIMGRELGLWHALKDALETQL